MSIRIFSVYNSILRIFPVISSSWAGIRGVQLKYAACRFLLSIFECLTCVSGYPCQRVKCACVQKPLAFYRVHGENYSLKNLDEEVKELEHWTKNQILSNLQNENEVLMNDKYNIGKWNIH